MSLLLLYNQGRGAYVNNLNQYDSDNKTPIATGGTSASGSASGVYLEMDMRPANEGNTTEPLTPYVEVQQNGTGFTGTATTTGTTTYYNPNEPVNQRDSPIIWDSVQKRFLMFGGAALNGTTETNALWELKMTPRAKWRQLSPTGTVPAARYMGGLSFDAINNQLVVVFGYTTTDTNSLFYCSFTGGADGAWTSRTPAGTAPSVRSNITGSVVTDYTNNCCYVFGGWGAAYYNGLYKLTFSSGTPGGTWSTLTTDGAAGSPSIRRNANMVLDSQNNRLIVFGGNNNGTANLNDVWQYSISGGTWTQCSPTGTAPAIRELATAAYDPVNHRMFMEGGYQGSVATTFNEYWTLDLSGNNTTPAWTNQSPALGQMPLGRQGGAAAYDPDDQLIVMWGGIDSSGDDQHQVTVFDVNETTNIVEYGLGHNHFMRPMDAPAPIYNPDTGEGVFIGGYSQIDDNTTIADGGHVTDVFAYNPTTNTWRVAARTLKSFFHREGIMAAYDTTGKRIIAFGGLWGVGGTNNGYLNDVWEIKANSNGDYDIRKMAPTGTAPGTRWLGACAYDSANNRFVVTMGCNGSSAWNDVWSLSLASGDGTWSQLTPTGTAPTAAWGVGFAFDQTNHILYITGGCTTAGADTAWTNQVVKLDLSTTNGAWTALATFPQTMRSMQTVLDPVNHKLVSFGGYDGTSVYAHTYFYDITGNSWSSAVDPTTEPAARRSSGMWYDANNAVVMMSHGRPVSGTWYGDTWKLTPNYGTPANTTWTAMNAWHAIRGQVKVTGLTNSQSYHWQGWAASSAGNSTQTARGGSPDFSLGTVVSTKTQSANARIQIQNLKAQTAIARIQKTFTLTQAAKSRMQKSFTTTQPAVARVQKSFTSTQSAVARIAPVKILQKMETVQEILTQDYTTTNLAVYAELDHVDTAKAYYHRFTWDPSKWDGISAIYFESMIGVQSGSGTTYAKLYNVTDGVDITGSEITSTTNSTTATRSGDISANMPTSTKVLAVWVKNSNTTLTSFTATGRLIVQQGTTATRFQQAWELDQADYISGTTTPTVDSGNGIWKYEATQYNGVTGIQLELNDIVIGAITGTFDLWDYTSSAVVITHTTTSTTPDLWLSGDITSLLTDGHEYGIRFTSSSSSSSTSACLGGARIRISQAYASKTQLMNTGIIAGLFANTDNDGSFIDPTAYDSTYAVTMYAEAVFENNDSSSSAYAYAADASGTEITNSRVTGPSVGNTSVVRVRNATPMTWPSSQQWYRPHNVTVAGTGAAVNVWRSIINMQAGTPVTKTQSAIARIAAVVTKTQGALARVANSYTKTQGAVARVANTYTKTQGAIARIAHAETKTQGAVARIQNTATKTQGATARIQKSFSTTQGAIARIGVAVTKTQGALARVANTVTKTQSAVARIQNTVTKTQTANARIAHAETKTQGAIARIAHLESLTQGAIARIANTATKTQTSNARIQKSFTKTQGAVARVQKSFSFTQGAIARIANTIYSRGTYTTLPTDNSVLATTYTSGEVTTVQTPGNATDITLNSTNAFGVHEFATFTGNTTDPISLTWIGKTSLAATPTKPVRLQIYNNNSSAWETLSSNTSVAANTQFTLTGSQATNVSYYFDSRGFGWVRVYQ